MSQFKFIFWGLLLFQSVAWTETYHHEPSLLQRPITSLTEEGVELECVMIIHRLGRRTTNWPRMVTAVLVDHLVRLQPPIVLPDNHKACLQQIMEFFKAHNLHWGMVDEEIAYYHQHQCLPPLPMPQARLMGFRSWTKEEQTLLKHLGITTFEQLAATFVNDAYQARERMNGKNFLEFLLKIDSMGASFKYREPEVQQSPLDAKIHSLGLGQALTLKLMNENIFTVAEWVAEIQKRISGAERIYWPTLDQLALDRVVSTLMLNTQHRPREIKLRSIGPGVDDLEPMVLPVVINDDTLVEPLFRLGSRMRNFFISIGIAKLSDSRAWTLESLFRDSNLPLNRIMFSAVEFLAEMGYPLKRESVHHATLSDLTRYQAVPIDRYHQSMDQWPAVIAHAFKHHQPLDPNTYIWHLDWRTITIELYTRRGIWTIFDVLREAQKGSDSAIRFPAFNRYEPLVPDEWLNVLYTAITLKPHCPVFTSEAPPGPVKD